MAGFEKNSAKRLVKATRRVEQIPRNKIMRSLGPRLALGGKLAITTSTISVHTSGTSLGHGTAILYTIAHDWTYSPMKGSPVVQVGNMSTTLTIASGQYVIVIPVDGKWVIDVVVC
jgi:hypothetical protein